MTEKKTDSKKSIYSEQFWSNVRMYLQKNKKTTQWLAEQTGLSAQSISSSYYLRSYDLRIATVLRICEVLDATPQELLFGFRGYETDKKKLNQQRKKANIDESNAEQVITNYLPILTENQIVSVLNHAVSYIC